MSVREQAQPKTASAPARSFSPKRAGLLQRRCACGGTPGLDGECAECRRKRMLGRPGVPIQAKLVISHPGDRYEREAERVAEQVTSMTEPQVGRQAKQGEGAEEKALVNTPVGRITPLVRRQVELEEEGELFLAGQDNGRTPGSITEIDARIQHLRGGGQPLPEQVLGFFEPRFGHRFDHVRIHTDARAVGAARALNAQAFTVGSDIVFGSGRFAPETLPGRRLLAHELTHVAQQEPLERRPAGARVSVHPSDGVLQRQIEVEDPRITGEQVLTHGIVYKQKGTELRDRPDPGSGSEVKRVLPFNTRLFVDRKAPGNWYHVTLTTGDYGYVDASDIKTNLPEPEASLHLIKEGESAIGIAETYYKANAQDWGEDLRFYVNVLEYVNRGEGPRGVYREKPGDSKECPSDISEVQSWKCVKTRANYLIWIPSVPFAKSLKGTVGTGSITYEAWTAVKEAAIAVGEFIVGGGAFVAGLLHGALESVWDLLVGLKDLAVMVWDLLKSLVTGEILGDAKNLWDKISNLDVSKLVEAWIDDFVGKWNNGSLLKKWHFRGWVLGYAIAEIAMWWFSGGAAAAAKWSGKMAKVAKVIAELPGVARVVTKAKSVKVPPALKSALKTGGEAAGDALKVARAWAATKLNVGAEILKDLTLEAIQRLQRLPEATLDVLRRFDTSTKRLVLGCASNCKVDIDAIKAYVQTAGQKAPEPPTAPKPPKVAEAPGPAKPPKAAETPRAAKPAKAAEAPKAAEPPPAVKEKMSGLQDERRRLERELAENRAKRKELTDTISREFQTRRDLWDAKSKAPPDRKPDLEKAYREATERWEEARRQLDDLPSEGPIKKKLDSTQKDIEKTDILLNPKEHRAALPCFSGDTLVWTAHGTRRIDTLRAGEMVFAFDFARDRVVKRAIVEVFENKTQHFYDLDVGGESIHATGQHRFRVASLSAWVAARDLEPGMRLEMINGKTVALDAIALRENLESETYNLSVEQASNYFVGPGLLVHNQGVDLGLGDTHVIYRGTNPDFPGKVYIGQTTLLDAEGKPRGSSKRQVEHRDFAKKQLRLHREGKIKLPPDQLEFYRFMSKVKLEPIVRGIATKAQADYLEQRNMDIERKLNGEDSLMNRREQIKSEKHIKKVTESIMKDPKVQAAGYCPK